MSNQGVNQKSQSKYRNIYMNTGVVSRNQPVSENLETANIISKAYDIAAKDHIKLEFLLMIIGIALLGLSIVPIILAAIGSLSIIGGLIGTAALAASGAIVILYGFFIHKPHEISMLSKVYTVSYLVPYKPALLFDGTDIIPDQVVSYKDVPLDKIRGLSSKLPNPPTSYQSEMNLVDIFDQKRALTGEKKTYKFVTPAVLNNNVYTNAVIDSLPFCLEGAPSKNPLRIKVSINEAVQHKQEIERLEEAEKVIKLMNEEKSIISHKSKPFVDNLIRCLNEISSYISNVTTLMRNRLFNGFNVNADRNADAEYGYEYVDFKYHIKVGSANKSLNPINMFQRVIDYFDNSVRKEIVRIRNDGERRIKDRQDRADNEERMTRQNYDMQIESKESEKLNYENQADSAYSQYSSLHSQYESCIDNANDYKRRARRARSGEYPNHSEAQRYDMMAQNETNQANNYKMQADNYYSQYKNAQSRVNALENEINSLENRKEMEIQQINDNARRDIANIKAQVKKEVIDSRKFINDIVKKRNEHIGMFDKICNTLIPSEKEVQSTPFNNRKNTIINLQNSILSSLDERIRERSGVLKQIESFKINANIQVPTSIAIPFWVMILNKKKIGSETVVFPPLKMTTPSEIPKSSWKYVNFTIPLSNALEKSTKYLKTNRIIGESRSVSIIGKIGKQIGSEIDSLILKDFIAPGYGKRIKKYYGIMPIGGGK